MSRVPAGLLRWLVLVLIVGASAYFGLRQSKQLAQSEAPEPARKGTNAVIEDGKEFQTLTADGASLVRREIVLMGSQFAFVLEADHQLALEAMTEVTERVRESEARISEWRPGSEISRINEQSGVAPVRVSAETLELVQQAIRRSKETDGYFDITVGPLWDLWPFRNPNREIPSDEELKKALPLVGSSKIQIDEKNSTVYLPVKGMRLNMGAIGKGHAVNLAIGIFLKKGIANAIVQAGGDMYVMGRKNSGPWIVGVENPRWPGQFVERFNAGDMAVSTSGDAHRFVIRNGKRYSHILDAHTGKPADDCQSVTIVGSNIADGVSAAVCAMGHRKGLEWVERRQDLAALYIDGSGRVHRSSRWSRWTRSVENFEQKKSSTREENLKPVEPAQPERTTPQRGQNQIPGRAVKRDSALMVVVNGYRIDRTEVSNAQYRKFVDDPESTRFAHPEAPVGEFTPRYWKDFQPPLSLKTPAAALAPFNVETFRKPEHPVVGVDWWSAYAYCRWAGKRLPTWNEWHRAAAGKERRAWPWGDEWDYTRANTGGEKWGENDGFIYSAPVVSFPKGASPYGALNMGGNVAEWTQEGFVAGGSSNSNPTGVSTAARVLREPSYRSFDIGFRCANGG